LPPRKMHARAEARKYLSDYLAARLKVVPCNKTYKNPLQCNKTSTLYT
jgi:hypothetical protein